MFGKTAMKLGLVCVVLASAIAAQSQGPWLGGQLEYVNGITIKAPQVLGLYVFRRTGTTVQGSGFVDKSGLDLRLGWMGWKVQHDLFGNKPCKVLDTDAFTTVTVKTKTRTLTSTIKVQKKTYINEEGRVVMEVCTWEDSNGRGRSEAIFGKDSIEFKLTSPTGNKSTTVFPAGGMDQFSTAFAPMIRNGEVVVKEKTFGVLHPISGGLQKVTARHVGRFDWSLSAAQVKKKGFVFEFVWPDHKQKAYISDKGELLKVDLPSGRILIYEIDK